MMTHSIFLLYAGCNVHVFGKCTYITNESKNGEEVSLPPQSLAVQVPLLLRLGTRVWRKDASSQQLW